MKYWCKRLLDTLSSVVDFLYYLLDDVILGIEFWTLRFV